MKLTQYGSIGLLGRVLPDHLTKYVPLQEVDVSHYGVDFSKAVVIISTYRDPQRTIIASEIKKIAEYVYSKGLIPVYVGKTGAMSIWKSHLAKSDFDYPGFGVDLRDKTSFLELASVMKKSRAVVGMDGGPIHIAFTTDVTVVCGFTTVSPSLRIPYRGIAKTIAVIPNIACNFCESDWSLDTWNFNNCPRKLELPECVTKMTSSKFIEALEQLEIFK
jgi:ADP-heptose:LPS heptosyltransferase